MGLTFGLEYITGHITTTTLGNQIIINYVSLNLINLVWITKIN